MVNYVRLVKELIRQGMREEKALKEVAYGYCLDLETLEASYHRERAETKNRRENA